MPRSISMLRQILLVTALILPMSGFCTPPDSIRISTGHWPPYLDKDAADGGNLAKLIREAFATQGIDVTFSFLPWSRALAMARAGKFEASAVWSCTKRRRQNFLFSEPVQPFRYVLFHRSSLDFKWTSILDWEGLRVGLTQDYGYGPLVRKAIESDLIKTDITTSDIANFHKLLLGRIDLFPMDPLTGMALMADNFEPIAIEQITFSQNPIREGWYHVIFSARLGAAEMLRDSFNRGLTKLADTGRYQELIQQMNMQWQKQFPDQAEYLQLSKSAATPKHTGEICQ